MKMLETKQDSPSPYELHGMKNPPVRIPNLHHCSATPPAHVGLSTLWCLHGPSALRTWDRRLRCSRRRPDNDQQGSGHPDVR